jgi:hypothetical protein
LRSKGKNSFFSERFSGMSPAINEMLTRREVLMQLRRVGVRKLSQLKSDSREFEQYMAVNYDYEIVKNERPRSSDWINSGGR